MRMLITASSAPGDKERIKTMRKVNQTAIGPDVYALVQRVQMSERDRHDAIEALRVAEGFAAAVLWVKGKVAEMGTWFLKPSVKH
jgi:hypothetical protein